jgi:low temperature requirement protein LtrA
MVGQRSEGMTRFIALILGALWIVTLFYAFHESHKRALKAAEDHAALGQLAAFHLHYIQAKNLTTSDYIASLSKFSTANEWYQLIQAYELSVRAEVTRDMSLK